eukprot:5396525-Amphidinium_carterae.1
MFIEQELPCLCLLYGNLLKSEVFLAYVGNIVTCPIGQQGSIACKQVYDANMPVLKNSHIESIAGLAPFPQHFDQMRLNGIACMFTHRSTFNNDGVSMHASGLTVTPMPQFRQASTSIPLRFVLAASQNQLVSSSIEMRAKSRPKLRSASCGLSSSYCICLALQLLEPLYGDLSYLRHGSNG